MVYFTRKFYLSISEITLVVTFALYFYQRYRYTFTLVKGENMEVVADQSRGDHDSMKQEAVTKFLQKGLGKSCIRWWLHVPVGRDEILSCFAKLPAV